MDDFLFILLILVIIITVIIAVLAVMNRIIFKMAFRNFARRKAQSVIVICGLMIGTAIISSALVVQDTMTYGFEVSTYHSLGEVDEDIWGLNAFGTVIYYNESIYDSISKELTSVRDIEAVVPLISDLGAVLDLDTKLGEPSVNILGLDSNIMRNTVFGDLDGHGYYTNELGAGEVAINSRLGDELEASLGDTIQLAYGVKDLSTPFGTKLAKRNFTIVKIINEKDLYGKANYNQGKTIFFELDTLQELFNREGEINHIWISNKGDYREGEKYTSKVNKTIEDELNKAVGMGDLGFSLINENGSLILTRDQNYFTLEHAEPLIEKAKEKGGSISYGLIIITLFINEKPTDGFAIMGGESDDETFRAMEIEPDMIYISSFVAANLSITNHSMVTVRSLRMDGTLNVKNLQVYVLPFDFKGPVPQEFEMDVLGYVDFTTSQSMLHSGEYEITSVVFVTGLNNATAEQIRTSVIEQMNNDFGAVDLNLEVHNVKADQLKAGREAGEGIGTLFLIFGMFSIIAGIVLIINIFVMMGEERKSEMGMARAVGMKSKHLVQMYLFEGSLYAFVAAIVGALLGLVFGWGIIQAFEMIFGAVEDGGGGFDIPFYFTWTSVFIAFCAGLLITFATIFFISTRITKLNIIRAIRRIPEPRTSGTKRREHFFGALLVVFGILFSYWGFSSSEGAGWMIGLPFLFIGSAVVLSKWVSFRATITTAGILIIFFMIPPFEIPIMSEADYSGAESFILSGIFLVLAGIFIVMFNSDLLLKALQRTVGRGKSTRAVLKTAISYPMDSKLKTGMTLGMFALIIFTVTVIAMIASMQASQSDAMLIEQSGGYDVMGYTNPRTPFQNLTKESLPTDLMNKTDRLETISSALVTIIDYDSRKGQISDYGPSGTFTDVEQYNLLGMSDSFLENNGFTLKERDKKYKTDQEAWKALKNSSSSFCIVDGSRIENMMMMGPPPTEEGGVYVGANIMITDYMGQKRTRNLTVIGIMDQMIFFQGIIVKKEVVKNEYGGVDNMVVIKLKSSDDADAYSKEFEKTYLEHGVQTFDIKGIINTILKLTNNMMYLMEGFLGIGLLVGIAGIGIISYRNVIERRQQIGMLRAIGFKKSMVVKSFLIETSFITILAILIGILLGIGIGWTIYLDGFRELGASFVIPWMNLLAICIIAYVATLIFTFYPSLKASKIPPAEALRYIE